MLAFQLNTFFRLHFFSLAFFGVGFSIIRASNFFPFFMSTCTAALEQELLVGDGWTDGSSEEEEGKRMGKELRVCVCVNCWDAGIQSERGCAVFLIAVNALQILCLNTVI